MTGRDDIVMGGNVLHHPGTVGHFDHCSIKAMGVGKLGIFWQVPFNDAPTVEGGDQFDQGDWAFG